MNNPIKILSVIIPVYNAGRYLEICILSVQNQMTEECEIILVDDGSTDGSGELCDQFGTHPDIHVIHLKNGGVSRARNRGIQASKAEYVMFLDSDDYLDQGCLRKVCKVAREEQPDMMGFAWRYVLNEEKSKENTHCHPKNVLLGRDYLKEHIVPEMINLTERTDKFIYDFSWAKVYKASILNQYGVWFDEKRRKWEDRPFVVTFLKYVQSIYFIDECFYNYVGQISDSLSGAYEKDIFNIVVENFDLYRKLWGEDYDFEGNYVKEYWFKNIQNQIMLQFSFIEEGKTTKEEAVSVLRKALSRPQIQKWYAEYPDPEKNKMIDLVKDQKIDEAMEAYQKSYTRSRKREKQKQFYRRLTGKISHIVKGIFTSCFAVYRM